jgi:protein gp37
VSDNTAISWATHTFNPWWGCQRVSPACRFCYAEAWDKRYGGDHWGANTERRTFSDKHWNGPIKWNRDAERSDQPVRVFCASMADVFEDHPGVVSERQRLWSLIERTPALTWMLLTKRPENVAGMVPWGESWPDNVWLGVSAETQEFAEQRIPILVQFPAAVRFVSAAPLLGAVDLTRIARPNESQPDLVWDVLGNRYGVPGRWQAPMSRGVDWVITEGESGSKARPSHPDWFRSLRDQCAATGVAFHHKQNGEFTSNGWGLRSPSLWVSAETGKWVRAESEVPTAGSWQALWKVGLKSAGRLLDGELHDAYPATRTAVSA